MNYDIELNANDSSVLETQYAFTQGDYGQIQFSIRVKADGSYVTNATRAYIVFTLPNGMVVTGADMSKSVATYTYVFQGNELQVAGTVLADVKLVYTEGQMSSNKFSFICRYDPLHDKSFDAGPYVTTLQQIVDEGQTKIDYLQTLIDALQGDVGSTVLTRSDLQNTRDAINSGVKAIDANVAQNLVLKSDIVNDYLATDPNTVLSGPKGKDLKEQLDTVNSNLANKGVYSGDLDNIPFVPNFMTVYRASNTCLNTPIVSFGIVETMWIDSTNFAIQRFTAFTSPPRIFVRVKDENIWKSWAEK